MKYSYRHILKDVSRSFYLSMRLLPVAMREPVSLAYLLARASDTLADTEGLDAQLRFEMLEGFGEILRGGDRVAWLAKLSDAVIPIQKHEGETRLLEKISEIFDWLDGFECARGRSAILQVMEHIIHGQSLDIERFEIQQRHVLGEDAELEQYCFLVAGCVGEFWTEIGNIALAEFSSIDTSQLKQMGGNYGKGLQLINILRDLPADIRLGRCYLPGVNPADYVAVTKEAARWRTRARSYLSDGEKYAASLQSRRTRAATALPGLIGERTIDLLDRASWEDLERGVKVPRRDVYRFMWESFFV
ncbi:MAG: phytoene/squalene synthase family protein [Akkermansiaceae bacterium]